MSGVPCEISIPPRVNGNMRNRIDKPATMCVKATESATIAPTCEIIKVGRD